MKKPSQSTHIFYVPGLGDSYDKYRIAALKRWSKKGLKVTHVPMHWSDRDENANQKLARLQRAIRESNADTIVLVGESAGGSIVVTEALRTNTKVTKAITIFGKNLRADRVSPQLYVKNPAFKASMHAADAAIASMNEGDGTRFTVFYSKLDPVISIADTKIPGATMLHVRTPGHIFSIALIITLLKHRVIREATNPA